jgi:glycosyltransferase involved in cell wall biosynthesis
MCACDPARLVVIVPAHHDAGRHAWARLDRLRSLVDCLRSLRAAVDQWRAGTGLAFDDVRIVLVDDGSPAELATLLPPDAVTSVDVLRLDTRRGQGAALNAALKTYRAGAYAFTDSDCVVAPTGSPRSTSSPPPTTAPTAPPGRPGRTAGPGPVPGRRTG